MITIKEKRGTLEISGLQSQPVTITYMKYRELYKAIMLENIMDDLDIYLDSCDDDNFAMSIADIKADEALMKKAAEYIYKIQSCELDSDTFFYQVRTAIREKKSK